jgi:5-methyltetrahydrofolate--homocysteine methyltransferase
VHKQARDFCGFGKTENLSTEDLIKEKYRGIRPAPGYPACPDHAEKIKLFELLDATNNTGVQLTESMAMHPGSSVCGYILNSKDTNYFHIARADETQLQNYAQRKGMSLKEATKFISI